MVSKSVDARNIMNTLKLPTSQPIQKSESLEMQYFNHSKILSRQTPRSYKGKILVYDAITGAFSPWAFLPSYSWECCEDEPFVSRGDDDVSNEGDPEEQLKTHSQLDP